MQPSQLLWKFHLSTRRPLGLPAYWGPRTLSLVKPQSFATPPEDRDMQAYDQDFHAWTQRTAELLRAGRFEEADIEHVAEEIEDMGRREMRELNSRIQVLMAHLLKWQTQSDRRSLSWRSTITAQRLELEGLLAQSPSLRPRLEGSLADNYARAVKRAAAESGLAADRFPPACPYRIDQILDEDFLP
jgi:hypothetical protein